MFNVIQALTNTAKSNKLLIVYYNSINNLELSSIIDLFILLGHNTQTGNSVKTDIRLYYGVFVDFFSWYGVFIDVNNKGYSIYVDETNDTYKSKGKEFLFHIINGDYYIRNTFNPLNPKNIYIIPSDYKQVAIQYNMFNAIVTAMEWLNI